MLKLLDLFSGIGGFSLGLESTGGFETIAFVEKDDFCQKVLKKHWPNTTIEGDIRNVKGDKYEADVITGGFPCQPFSVAGKRKGVDDDRYLWDETIRVVRECKPRWFIGENVEGLININNGVVLRQVQTDLEKEGFEVQCLIIPASGIGAWHQRKRIWIVGANVENSNSRGRCWEKGIRKDDNIGSTTEKQNSNIESSNERCGSRDNKISINVSDTNSKMCRGRGTELKSGNDRIWGFYLEKEKQTGNDVWSETIGRNDLSIKDVSNSNNRFNIGENKEIQTGGNTSSISSSNGTKETWWQTQSRICGVPNGVSFELDKGRNNRIKSLGNSIVPQIVRELGFAILEAEK